VTAPADSHSWVVANQEYLSAALAIVRAVLEARAGEPRRSKDLGADTPADAARKQLERVRSSMLVPPALEVLSDLFELSPFERDLLVLVAGIELSSSFAGLCAKAQGEPTRSHPTFSLALSVLDDPHWSAVTASGPLRRWRLLEVESGSSLTTSVLRIDERILCFLTGIDHLDERLLAFVRAVEPVEDLVPSHAQHAERIAALWGEQGPESAWPAVQLVGDDPSEKRAIAQTVASRLGLRLFVASAELLPQAPHEAEALLRLWVRESVLSRGAILLEVDGLEGAEGARVATVAHFVERCRSPLFWSTRARKRFAARAVVTIDVERPLADERVALWRSVLQDKAQQLNGAVEEVAAHFNLTSSAIRAASIAARAISTAGDQKEAAAAALWMACRSESRDRLDELAQRIVANTSWEDLVVPPTTLELLREMVVHLRQRRRVYEEWGFAHKGSRGLGISALFSGSSGTGKTMAAEVIANALNLDLYRVDLSQTVSKYIGETEKNLKRVFDAAEGGGALLLFDEADALFGRRSEVKDSHDRYSNIEVSYLLQRMEEYRGLAILTTNFKDAIDSAFLRRLRFVIPFPFPDVSQRALIWRQVFPRGTPLEGLDYEKLARLNVAGGNIRNVAVFAAFLAADRAEPVRMSHLVRAARVELQKLERTPTEAEIGGWS